MPEPTASPTASPKVAPEPLGAAAILAMSGEERRAWLDRERPRHDLAAILRAHVFHASRPLPDGTPPAAPNWNPGCSCDDETVLYSFEHDLHVADAILTAGFARNTPKADPATGTGDPG